MRPHIFHYSQFNVIIPQSQCKHGHITATISSHRPCAVSQTNSTQIYSKLHNFHPIQCHLNPAKYEADIPSLTSPNLHFTVCTYLPIVLLYPLAHVVIAANCAVTPKHTFVNAIILVVFLGSVS